MRPRSDDQQTTGRLAGHAHELEPHAADALRTTPCTTPPPATPATRED